MRSLNNLALLPLLAAASPVLIDTIHNQAAPVLSSVDAKEIPDSYMVVFKDHVTHNVAQDHHSWVQDIHNDGEQYREDLRKRSLGSLFSSSSYEGLKHTYHIPGGFLGYSGHFDEDVIEQIRNHPDVEYIEKDTEVHIMKDKDEDEDKPELENNAPWGLARVSHRDRLSFGTFNKYLYAEDGGEGVDVYIIDTGTYVDHVDFEGRASWGKTIPENDEDADGNGHGTHCSGTVGGKKYGIAKKAHIKAVKVLRSNGSGSMSDVVKGVEFAAESHLSSVEAAKNGTKKGFKGSAANMSLGGGKSTALDRAVNAAVEVGIHFSVAAGNDNADACNYSPAAAENPVTVGASSLADERAYFSNYGKCVDIFAPGLNILSTWIGSEVAVNTISGTSMASPHIAGLLAYFLSLQPSKDSAYAVAEISPKTLKKHLVDVATENALEDIPSDTVNLLAWNGGGSSNFTEIVENGGYEKSSTVGIQSIEKFTKDGIDFTRERLSDGVKDVEFEIVEFGGDFADRAEKIADEIEDLIEDELEELFGKHGDAESM